MFLMSHKRCFINGQRFDEGRFLLSHDRCFPDLENFTDPIFFRPVNVGDPVPKKLVVLPVQVAKEMT